MHCLFTFSIFYVKVKNLPEMAAMIDSVDAVNDFLESDEDVDLEDIIKSPAIQSFFNIHLLTDQNDF